MSRQTDGIGILTRLPLQRRIMALVAGGLGLTLLLVAIAGIGVLAQSTDRVLQERLVMARVAAATLDERLKSSLLRLEALASATPWGLPPALSSQARRTLELSASRPGLFSGGFLVVDRSRRVLWPPAWESVAIDEPALSTALIGTSAVSGLVRPSFANTPAVITWVPLRAADGSIAGALGGVIDLQTDALVDLIRSLALGRTGHAVIVDGDGVILAGTEEHERFTRGDHPDFFAQLIRAHKADVGRTPEIEDGVEKEMHVMAFAPLSIGNWGLGFGQSEWEVFFHERHLRQRILLLGLVLLVLGLWFGWRDAGAIARPLRRLITAAQRIARGDLDSPIPTESGHEIGMLAGSLEAMRASLQQMRAELESRAAIIERHAQQTHALYDVSRAILSEANLSDVLSTIASSARTLLNADASVACLWDPERRRLVPGALQGPAEAFHSADGAATCEQIGPDGTWQLVGQCPFVRPAFRQMHVTASLRAGDRLIGFMCVGSTAPRTFTEEDANLLTSLASLAAIAIESAQLRERVQHLAVLEERERIGRDLHDSIIQSLYGINLTLEHSQHLAGTRPTQAVTRLEDAIGAVTEVIKDIRSYVLDLHPGNGEDSLVEALERVVREFRANTLLPVEFQPGDSLPHLAADQRLHLQLLVREALANVARHAQAGRVIVSAKVQDDQLRLVIADDGRGFDVDAASLGEGLGLRTMTERARLLGGTMEVRSHTGAGTTIQVDVPVSVGRSVAR